MADPERYHPKEEVWAEIPPRTLLKAALITIFVISCSTLFGVSVRAAFLDFGFWGGLGVTSIAAAFLSGCGLVAVKDHWKAKGQA